MDFRPPDRRRRGESIVPMINVVFLLLVFFMMTAQLAPPDPFEIDRPVAEGGAASGGPGAVLHVDSSGMLDFGGLRGAEAIAAIAARTRDAGPLTLRADARVPAARLAAILSQLAGAGVPRVALIVRAP